MKVTVDMLQSGGPKVTVTDDNNIILATKYLSELPETDGALVYDGNAMGDGIREMKCPKCSTVWAALCHKENVDLECPACHKMVSVQDVVDSGLVTPGVEPKCKRCGGRLIQRGDIIVCETCGPSA